MAYKNIDTIIINTSCNLFMEKGYKNVSVNEICSACSITKPTLYYHFKSKEDILYEYFRSLIQNSINLIIDLEKHNIISGSSSAPVSDDKNTDVINSDNSDAANSNITNSNITNSNTAVSDISNSDALNENEEASMYYNGKKLVTEAFNLLFSIITAKGYDMTQSFISACICDISKALYFPAAISDAITEYIKIGQKDGSILNTSKADELFTSFYHAFVGYIVYWCQHNGLTDEENTLTNAILPLFN